MSSPRIPRRRHTDACSASRSRAFGRAGAALALAGLVAAAAALAPAPAAACGGFFCQQAPIDQAGEQIVFRQEGDRITAMVRILYRGSAEEFSWVVPVPDTPELDVGADLTFDELDLATRPDFRLERTGDSCPVALPEDAGAAESVGAEADGEGVTVESEVVVGPYEAQVVSGEDAGAMARWLVDNGYDLTSRGEELLAPYVEAGMKFVALKLRSGEDVGSIRPLVMRYASDRPTVPIRLTAVAAEPDMGVLVWLVADARAVPTNYLHVTPNWTRLNWYAGPQNAYASYQDLVTEAMDEAGGQGFATDVARPIDAALVERLTSPALLRAQLDAIDANADDAAFLAELWFAASGAPPLQRAFRDALPLPERRDELLYTDPFSLRSTYTEAELRAARATLTERFETLLIEPLEVSTALFPEGAYLTRVYTTLSPEEMTLDPTFDFNPDMPDQGAIRRATLDVRCADGTRRWTLTLGEGTGREGETVIAAAQPEPFGPPAAVDAQGAFWTTERTSADAAPELVERRRFATLALGADGETLDGGAAVDGAGEGGAPAAGGGTGGGAAGALALAALVLARASRGRRAR